MPDELRRTRVRWLRRCLAAMVGSALVLAGPEAVHPTNAAAAGSPRIVRLAMDHPQPDVGQPVRFSAQLSGSRPRRRTWTVVALPGSEVQATATTATVTHAFAATGRYRASLVVTDGTHTDRRSRDFEVTAHVRLACGSVVTQSTTLTADVVCSPDQLATSATALTVGADGVTLDLGGHTVGGEIAANDFSRVTVRHGTAVAVRVQGAYPAGIADLNLNGLSITRSDVAASSMTIDGSREAGGVRIDSASTGIRRSTISRAAVQVAVGRLSLVQSTLRDSPVVLSSWGSRVLDATVSDNHLIRSGITASANVAILRNVIDGAGIGIDIRPLEGTYPTSRATVGGNTITGGRVGIRLNTYWYVSSTVSGNTVRHAAAAGMLVEGESGPDLGGLAVTQVAGNTLDSNGYRPHGLTDRSGRAVNDGLHVDTAAGTPLLLTGNRATRNADYGIEAAPGSVRDGGGNTSTGSPAGCLGVTCS